MSNNWPKVKLGEVLHRSEESVELLPDVEYQEITVKLWGKGVVLRGVVNGAEVAAARRMVARGGQFILSRIDARNGALGIVPDQLDGAIVSNDFPVFNLSSDRVVPSYMGWICKTAAFVELCQRASEGTTNRVRLQEEKFLTVEIPLPPLPEQRRIVARIEDLAAKIEGARILRRQAVEETASAVAAAHRHVFRVLAQRHREFRIDSFAEVKGGKRLPRGERLVESNTGFPYIRAGNLKDGTVIGEILFLPPELQTSIAPYIVVAGDVYITIVGACIGDVGIIPDEFHNANLTENAAKITIRDEKSVNSKFLVHALRSPEIQELLANKRTIAAQPKLALHRIRSTCIPLPPLSEQRRTVDYLDELQAKVDELKKAQTETLVVLDALMPSILDKAFRGDLLPAEELVRATEA